MLVGLIALLMTMTTLVYQLWPEPYFHLEIHPSPGGHHPPLIHIGGDENWRDELMPEMVEWEQGYDFDRTTGEFIQDCRDGIRPPTQYSCFFDPEILGPSCRRGRNYGYDTATPCVILTPSQVLDWEPEVYNTTDEVPRRAPEELQLIMRDAVTSDRRLPPKLWISCEGITPADKENVGTIEYYPRTGFDYKYFPYNGEEHYHSPSVALRFTNVQRNVLIHVKCTPWAKNIDDLNKASVEFQLLVE